MPKFLKVFSIVFFVSMSSFSYAGGWCQGYLTEIRLNVSPSSGPKNLYAINGVYAEFNSDWTEIQLKEAFALLLTAKTTKNEVKYWGSTDCKKIESTLYLL